ncbi:hypothetical protein V1520DRAFT_387376 [Lipomyces starkeyi]
MGAFIFTLPTMLSLLPAIVGYTVTSTFLILLLCIVGKLFQRSITPGGVPWLFRKKGFLSQGLERLLGIDSTRSMHDGYTKYAKFEQPFILPSALEGDHVLIPKEYVASILRRKESDVSFKAHLAELFQVKYTSLPYFHEIYDVVVKLISKDMTKLLESPLVAEDLSNEARACLIELWGQDTDNWIEVPLNPTLEKMTGRLINLLAVGTENCRMGTIWWLTLQTRVVGALIGLVKNWYLGALDKHLRPIIELKMAEHLRTISSNQSEKPEIKVSINFALPFVAGLSSILMRGGMQGTFLDIMIDNTFKAKSILGRRPEQLAYSIFMMTFPGVHSSGVSGSSCILDLLSCPPEQEVLEILREEVREISSHCQGTWTAEDLSNALLLDGAIKESLRLNGLNAIAPARMVLFFFFFFSSYFFPPSLSLHLITWNPKLTILGTSQVINPDGTTLPNGVHLPYGTHIGIPQWAIHRDNDIYPNPQQFNPWRFSSENTSAEWKRPNAMTITSETYLAFGYGRRTCAGRYIFAHIFKLLMAEILLNYDIKPIGSRPKVKRWGRFQVPSKGNRPNSIDSRSAKNSRYFTSSPPMDGLRVYATYLRSIFLLYLMLMWIADAKEMP